MNVTEAVAAVLEAQPSALCVSSLGTPTSALRSASRDGPHLYLGGSMGCALAVALGVAERRSERAVVAFLGDGELLMRAGSLWATAALAPRNLLVVVLADGGYAITGGQPLVGPTVFADVAGVLPGLSGARVSSAIELAKAAVESPRPALIEATVSEQEWPGPSPFVDPLLVRSRFSSEIESTESSLVGGAPWAEAADVSSG